jgi:hypothetical protein
VTAAAPTPAPPHEEGARATPPYARTDDVRALVAAFESCTLPHAAWTHAAHLTVAAWYLVWFGPDEATNQVRAGILRYNAANGIQQTRDGGYHETVTRFYMWAVGRHLRGRTVDGSLADLVNEIVVALDDRSFPLAYYSRERLFSWKARTTWVEPDLRALD